MKSVSVGRSPPSEAFSQVHAAVITISMFSEPPILWFRLTSFTGAARAQAAARGLVLGAGSVAGTFASGTSTWIYQLVLVLRYIRVEGLHTA